MDKLLKEYLLEHGSLGSKMSLALEQSEQAMKEITELFDVSPVSLSYAFHRSATAITSLQGHTAACEKINKGRYKLYYAEVPTLEVTLHEVAHALHTEHNPTIDAMKRKRINAAKKVEFGIPLEIATQYVINHMEILGRNILYQETLAHSVGYFLQQPSLFEGYSLTLNGIRSPLSPQQYESLEEGLEKSLKISYSIPEIISLIESAKIIDALNNFHQTVYSHAVVFGLSLLCSEETQLVGRISEDQNGLYAEITVNSKPLHPSRARTELKNFFYADCAVEGQRLLEEAKRRTPQIITSILDALRKSR